MTYSKKNLLAKSGVISLTGSPVPYGISYLIFTFFSDLNSHDASLWLTIGYTLVNTLRIYVIEYIFAKKGIKVDDSVATLIRRIKSRL